MANRLISRRLLQFAVRSVSQFQSQSVRSSFGRRYSAATVAVVSAVAGYLTYRTVSVQAKSPRDEGSTAHGKVNMFTLSSLQYLHVHDASFKALCANRTYVHGLGLFITSKVRLALEADEAQVEVEMA
jgi:hypothetical protein